jgi:hypothetical protein
MLHAFLAAVAVSLHAAVRNTIELKAAAAHERWNRVLPYAALLLLLQLLLLLLLLLPLLPPPMMVMLLF